MMKISALIDDLQFFIMMSIFLFVPMIMIFLIQKQYWCIPIYERPPENYSAHQIMQIVLNPKIDKHRTAMRRPLEVPYSSTFVMDISKLGHPDNIKEDMYGKWLHSGSHSDVFICSYSQKDKYPLKGLLLGLVERMCIT